MSRPPALGGVAVAGTGMTEFGRFPEADLAGLGERAARAALDDAGVSPAEVDGVWCGNVVGGGAAGQRALVALGIEGVPVCNLESACASGSQAFAEAVTAVRSGRSRCALVLGVEKTSGVFDGVIALDRSDLPSRLGLSLPGIYALNASRYLWQYGADAAALAAVSVKNRRAGARNPRAMFRAEVSVDEVLGSRPIAEPFTLLQCCANADGAAAVVLLAPDESPDGAPRVLGCGVASGYPIDAAYDLTRSRITETAARRAYADAGVTPEVVDAAEVHDAFTVGEIIALESLGLAERGTAWRLAPEGVTSAEGRLPVNASGGLLARGHAVGASGVAQIVELSRQLRDVSENPLPRAGVVLAHTVGGGMATHDGIAAVVTLLARPAAVPAGVR